MARDATSLIFILIAPILWLPFAIWGWHEVRFRTAMGFAGRTILLTALANLWWVSGLYTQAGWGLDVLAYTETVKTVASSSQASEVLRGLGNWYFYGRDGIAAWVEPANSYTGNLLLMAIFPHPDPGAVVRGLPAVGIARLRDAGLRRDGDSSACIRTTTRHRSDRCSRPSRRFRPQDWRCAACRERCRWWRRSRGLPGRGVHVLSHAVAGRLARRPQWVRYGRYAPAAAFGVVVVLVLANMAPLFQGQFVDKNLERPQTLPSYMTQSANYMNSQGDATRVLELPGADFRTTGGVRPRPGSAG